MDNQSNTKMRNEKISFLCKICNQLVFKNVCCKEIKVLKYCNACLVNYVFGVSSLRSMIIKVIDK